MIMLFNNLMNFGTACLKYQVQDLNKNNFFFLDHWWKYLKLQQDALGNCVPTVDIWNHPNDLWLIGLAVLDSLLKIAGFVAVISIIIAGAQLITAEGSPDKAVNARNRLVNSLVGVAIAVSATAFVSFLGNSLGGSGTGLPKAAANSNSIQSILNIAFAILGALAFLYIVLAGLRFVVSGDNTSKVAEARRQIIYAAAGLMAIALSATIVNYVLGRLS
jgi:hypothetical protein